VSQNPKVCFDASTALAVALQDDPKHAAAVALMASLAAQNAILCAPAMFTYECDSVIRLRVYRGNLSATDATTARAIIQALGVVVEYDPGDRERAFQIATDYSQPRVYDAAYAAHAEARGVELVTADEPFFEAVNGASRPKKAPPLTFVQLLVAPANAKEE
jgi:predicted nucleic acid-binding protein